VLAVVMVNSAARFLRVTDVSASGAVTELQNVSTRSDTGGSAFQPVVVRSPLQVPKAFITVLFRPFPTEADNAQAMAAALESTFLLFLTLKRLPWVKAALLSMRRQAYVGLALAYTTIFVVAFASFPNFGLLVRERDQLFPFFVVLLSIPSHRRGTDETEVESDGALATQGS